MPDVRSIVVGTDGSRSATVAMRWAAEEAELHESSVEVVLACQLLDQHERSEGDARATLAAWVVETLGTLVVRQRVVLDVPVRALLEASDAADLLVLGAHGTGGFEGLILGSTSERVAQLAIRPVAVVRAPAPVRGGRVVVGIDGSVRSRNALRWAAMEARARDADLEVVHAWQLPTLIGPLAAADAPDPAIIEASGRTVLDRAVADTALLDGVRVRPHLACGSPTQVIMSRARGAGLIVAGKRGRGRISSALLGSVSRQLLHHARCPIVVV